MRRGVLLAALGLLAAGGASGDTNRPSHCLLPGLLGEYYDIGAELSDYPDLRGRTPALRRIDGCVNFENTAEKFAGTEFADCFYVRWTGVVRLPRSARYTFYTSSDDGSRLLIDGRVVVDNGGLHSFMERPGAVDLKAGDHAIVIEMFENRGWAGCVVSWQSAALPKEVVPAKALFHLPERRGGR